MQFDRSLRSAISYQRNWLNWNLNIWNSTRNIYCKHIKNSRLPSKEVFIWVSINHSKFPAYPVLIYSQFFKIDSSRNSNEGWNWKNAGNLEIDRCLQAHCARIFTTRTNRKIQGKSLRVNSERSESRFSSFNAELVMFPKQTTRTERNKPGQGKSLPSPNEFPSL